MSISRKEVEHVAGLARLTLTPDQVETHADHLSQILKHMDKLTEVDTDGLEPTYHAVATKNVFREDKIIPRLTREEALANAPEADSKNVFVPRVI